jgi:hypothetical protein
LPAFPDKFGDKKGSLEDLSSYDVIVCFDPDWKQLTPNQTKLIANWARKGGGLVYLGGHFNTVNLVFPPEDEDPAKFQPILELLPVVLGDRRDYLSRKAETPFSLNLDGASPEIEFFRLDEDMTESQFKEDWKQFFFGEGKEATTTPQRGFFNIYPIKSVKLGSIVAARYTDPATKLREGKEEVLHPFIVLKPNTAERVIWIGSTETWRLREYKEAYHERFWTKLLRYAAANSKGKLQKRIRLEMNKVYTALKPIEIEAKIEDSSGLPWDKSNKPPRIFIKAPAGVPESEIKKAGIVMTARVGAQEGWYSGRFMLKTPGEYELSVKVPDPLDTTGKIWQDTETQKFTLKPSNPELDDTRPDFDRMYRLASEADGVFNRLNDADRNELKKQLVRPKIQAGEGKEKDAEFKDDKQRLYFTLKNADFIPRCMRSDVSKQNSRGPVNDYWDDGLTIYNYPPPTDATKQQKPPVKISYVLMLVAGLLSIEWLIRKLLRLA